MMTARGRRGVWDWRWCRRLDGALLWWVWLVSWGMGLVPGGGPVAGMAQDLRYLRHQGWTTEDGLPQDSVHGVVQTRDGYLWVGTEGGLARFDGMGFRVFGQGTDRAFASGDVSCLLAGADGVLWVGTADGVVRVERGGGRSTHFGVKDGLPAIAVLALRMGEGGTVQVETAGGWAEWRGAGFKPAKGSPEGAMGNLVGSGAGWTATDAGVTLERVGQVERWTAGRELPGSRVESFVLEGTGADGAERAWAGTNAGLFLLRAGQAEVVAAPWLRGDAVLTLTRDREGDVWAGTESSGLHVLRPARFRTESALGGDGVVALVQSGATVWVGSRRDGVRAMQAVPAHGLEARSRGTDGIVREIARGGMTSAVVLSLAPAESGGAWVGTPDGLNLVGRDGSVRQMSSTEGLPDDYVLALAADGSGGVWAGTRRGLVHVVQSAGGELAARKVLTRGEGLAGDLVGAVLRGKDGVLWVATSGGVSRRGLDGVVRGIAGEWGRGSVRTLAADQDGAVWVGTSEGWVGRVQPGGEIDGLRMAVVADAIDGMVVEGGKIWLRTAHGIGVIGAEDFGRCAKEGCRPAAVEYGIADGMPSVEEAGGGQPVAWRMKNGELWFGTRHGVAIVDPGLNEETGAAPPVVIERFVADGVELPVSGDGSGLEVPYGHVRFTAEYAGLDFAAPGKVRYRYRLIGLDAGWTEVGSRRSATYTNLRPGRYRFEVEAADGSGRWGEPGAELRFRVVPPVYRTWWFLLLLVLCGAGVVVGLYLLRLRRLRREFDAVLRERNRMAREIHDTLAQDFVGVSLKLDIALQMLGMGKTEAAAGQLRETRVLVTEGLQEARQSIWGLRANVAADSLPARLTRVVDRFRGEGLEVLLKVGGAYRVLEGRTEGEVVRVGQEALQNVKRHAGVGRARVELEYRSDMLVLTVEDEGKGFRMSEAERMEGHYGVRGMQERAAAVGGRLVVTTEEGRGTRVELLCPIAGGAAEMPAEEGQL